MNRNLIAFLIILVLGMLGIGGYKLASNFLEDRGRVQASDSKVNRTIRVGGDGYQGYFFVNSPETKQQLARRGLGVDLANDNGAYADRLKAFHDGKYDAIVLPINSYIQHGKQYGYEGVIVASIADSKGADSIMCFQNRLPTGKVQDLNNASLKIVYTPESPSSFLLDLTMVDFDLFNLTKTDTWRVEEPGGSPAVLEKAKKGQGDCFVMWEPEVLKATREVPGLQKVWGSDRFSGYITDVIVFRYDFVRSHPDDVIAFLEAYFSAMRVYASDEAKLTADMSRQFGMKPEDVKQILAEIDWFDLQENVSQQFGIASGVASGQTKQGLYNSIIAITDVMVRTKKLDKDPIGDPYKILNSKMIEQVQQRLPATIGNSGVKRTYRDLDDAGWANLKYVGLMRVEPITFQTGSAVLDSAGEASVDKIGELLNNQYTDYRVILKGHTSASSDEPAAQKLSQERAEAVIQRLVAVTGLPRERLRAEGKGSLEPPAKRPDENPRQYMYRIPRVEFHLLSENSF